jgi:hypothetical protein
MLSEAELAFLRALEQQLPSEIRIELEPVAIESVLSVTVKLTFGAIVPITTTLVNDAAMRPFVVREVSTRVKRALAGALLEFLPRLDAD